MTNLLARSLVRILACTSVAPSNAEHGYTNTRSHTFIPTQKSRVRSNHASASCHTSIAATATVASRLIVAPVVGPGVYVYPMAQFT
jgi:hypothetical protein